VRFWIVVQNSAVGLACWMIDLDRRLLQNLFLAFGENGGVPWSFILEEGLDIPVLLQHLSAGNSDQEQMI
jgi:hypothetical protein